MPDVQERLVRGVSVADIGCGRGRGVIKLAQTFPRSHYVGYDVFQPTIDRANANAQAAGVADRVRFQQLDASHGLPEQYDVITTFDVVHDAADPRGCCNPSVRRCVQMVDTCAWRSTARILLRGMQVHWEHCSMASASCSA